MKFTSLYIFCYIYYTLSFSFLLIVAKISVITEEMLTIQILFKYIIQYIYCSLIGGTIKNIAKYLKIGLFGNAVM